MISNILLLILSITTLVVAATNNNTCLATTSQANLCNQNIYSHCQDASLVIYRPEWASCTKAQLYWGYPANNLTIQFISPPKSKAVKRRTYQFDLDEIADNCVQVYRVLDNGEATKVTWKGSSPTSFQSEVGSNSFTFRFQAANHLVCFGSFISYLLK